LEACTFVTTANITAGGGVAGAVNTPFCRLGMLVATISASDRGVFLSDLADCVVTDIVLMYCNAITNSSSFYCNDTYIWQGDSIANGAGRNT
jgi:hypothetical protein